MSVKTSWRSVSFCCFCCRSILSVGSMGEGGSQKKKKNKIKRKKNKIKSSTISVDIVTAIRLFLIRLNSFYLSCLFFLFF